MSDEILVRHVNDEAGERVHLLHGATTDPDNFNITITPTPSDDLLTVVLDVLAPGWEEHQEAYPVPAWDPLSGMIHVGTTIRRNGYTLDIARAFVAAEIDPKLRRSDIVHEVHAHLKTRPKLRPFTF
jgi:hypothetical protein